MSKPDHDAEEFQPLPEYDHDISDAMRQAVEKYLDKASDALVEAYRTRRSAKVQYRTRRSAKVQP